jgi:hypothetical protein
MPVRAQLGVAFFLVQLVWFGCGGGGSHSADAASGAGGAIGTGGATAWGGSTTVPVTSCSALPPSGGTVVNVTAAQAGSLHELTLNAAGQGNPNGPRQYVTAVRGPSARWRWG